MEKTSRLFRIGAIADVQYVDRDNGWDFHHTKERFYRESRESMRTAIKCFREHDVDLILQLGDLCDGLNGKDGENVLQELCEELRTVGKPLLNCIGNHELYCCDKTSLKRILGNDRFFAFSPCKGWKILVLDAYGFSMLHKETEEEAYQFLKTKNPNDVRSNVDWTAGLSDENLRFVPYNGGIDKEQLTWLEQQLQNKDDKVLIACHIPLQRGSCQDETLAWNCEDVLKVLWNSKAKVVACFAGHDHDGGYLYDKEHDIHHITMQSPMTCRNIGKDQAHSIVDVFESHMEIKGFGSVDSFNIKF